MKIRTVVLACALALPAARAFADEPTAEAPAAGEHHGEEVEDPSRHFNFTNFDYKGKDELGGKMGDGVMEDKDAHGNVHVIHEEEPMSPPFVLMLLNFGVVLALLAWKGGPIARKVAAERHDLIKTALDEAAKLRDQAAKRLFEYETKLKAADAEVAKLVAGIRADAEADKARILAAAETQAVQLKRDAELRIAAEIETARAALTREVTAAAAAAAEKILRDKTTPADQERLVGTFITNVERQGKEAR